MTDISERKIVYIEPRLKMTYAGRLFLRAITAVAYVALSVGTLTALLSDVAALRAFGGLLLLFCLDRIFHIGQGDIPFSEIPKVGEINLAHFMAPKSHRLVERAFERAHIKQTNFYLEAATILFPLSEIKDGLVRLDIKPQEFEHKLEDLLRQSGGFAKGAEERYAAASTLVSLSAAQALHSGHRFIRPCDLFSALASVDDKGLSRLFHVFSVSSTDLEASILLSETIRRARSQVKRGLSAMIPEIGQELRHRVMNRAWTARPTPTLDKYSSDLTDLARAGGLGFLIGHEKEYERLTETLSKGTNPNALLVGEAGIGKETIISHLAFDIVKDNVPKELFDRRLVALDISKLIAGAAPEIVQQRVQAISSEITGAGNVILYLPEIHNLLKTSGQAYLSAADALLPIIQNSAFPVVGTTYPKEFKLNIEPQSGFAALFEVINVEEISEEEAGRILTLEGVILEKKTGVEVSFGAVKTAVTLAKKYFRGTKFLPSSADELLKSAVAVAERKGEKKIGPEEVIAAAEMKTNVPIHEAKGEEAEELLNFESIIHKKFIDQEEAVKSVGNALREYRSGLARKGGPIASFLFVGPTGVGKTELAKMVAEIQFGSKDLMARFDMTEYQDKKSFERFIGSPDGSVRGALTDRVLAKPYGLILLDEFEKAFPDILDLFLQVLDDGRLTDGLGRTVDFGNTVIIATSNAHSDIINSSLNEGKPMTAIADYLKKRLTDVFKPELINRFSRVVVFRDLKPEELILVADLQLKELAASLLEQGISLKLDPSVAQYIVKIGYDPAFGARPLRRVIEEKLRATLAEKILRKEIEKGGEVTVSVEGEELVFK